MAGAGGGGTEDDSPHMQQLRAAMHLAVGRICDDVGTERGTPFERSTVAAITARLQLGTTPGNGKAIGLDEKWALNAIKAVGNYGEVWTRNIVPLGLPRGINNLWSKGGIMYAPPVR